jgi:hypothetical protein
VAESLIGFLDGLLASPRRFLMVVNLGGKKISKVLKSFRVHAARQDHAGVDFKKPFLGLKLTTVSSLETVWSIHCPRGEPK